MRLDFPEAPAHERPRGGPAATVKITFYLCAGGLPRDPRLRTFKLHAAGFFSQESGILGIRKSRPRLRPARLSGSARGGFPAAGAVSGTLRRGIPFWAFQKLGHRRGENAPGERAGGPRSPHTTEPCDFRTISRTQCGNNKNIKMHVFLITTTRHGSCTLDQMRRRYHGLWGTKEGNAIRARRAKHAPGRSFCVQTTACFFSS